MAKFQPGQRVRIRAGTLDCEPECAHLVGREATILGRPGPSYRWFPDEWELSMWVNGVTVVAREQCLEPLTDPKADAFIESLKRPIFEEPKVVKVTV